MANPTASMTTQEFSKATRIPAATVSKLIRDGKIKAKKVGKCWMIPAGQLEAKAVRELGKTTPPPKSKKTSKPTTAAKAVKPAAAKGAGPVVPVVPVAAEPVSAPEAPAVPEAAPEKTYTMAEFVAMTYLTEKGVAEWLKSGRLKGRQMEGGQWVVFESNLQVPDISRLLRK